MSTVTAGAKLCISCGKDVTSGQRMKDSQGQYWCLPCGESDRKMRKLGFSQHSVATTAPTDEAADAAKKKKKMLMIVGVLIVVAILINFFVL